MVHSWNIRRLVENERYSFKKMADRVHDPNDFYMYPVYFRRPVTAKNNKPRKMKKKKLKTRPTLGLTPEVVAEALPAFTGLTEQYLESLAETIGKLILKFELKDIEEIDTLKEMVFYSVRGNFTRETIGIID